MGSELIRWKALLISSLVMLSVPAALAAEDWKALYKDGKLNTPFKHFSVIADGVAGPGAAQHGGKPGPSWLGMRLWAGSTEEAIQMFRRYAEEVGFAVKGKIDVYDTEPMEPPREAPHFYSVRFTPYAVPKKK